MSPTRRKKTEAIRRTAASASPRRVSPSSRRIAPSPQLTEPAKASSKLQKKGSTPEPMKSSRIAATSAGQPPARLRTATKRRQAATSPARMPSTS
ncbi:MAG: hypothetical protein BGO11_02430 [Solirubrobacterales bacterium 70-9]|nr:MAG: hypothetical protein BGO11_02430 [Solirubrobacterales bacterium 70-9]